AHHHSILPATTLARPQPYSLSLHDALPISAERAGVDALIAVYHADHRELCAHERDYPFRIMNVLEIVGASIGINHQDQFKRLKLMQDADAIASDCQDLIAQHGLDPAATRDALQAKLDEQPPPLR